MNAESSKETARFIRYQGLFRFLVGFAGIATLAISYKGLSHDLSRAIPLLLAACYIASANFILQRLSQTAQARVWQIMAFIDALLLGALLALLHLCLIPSLLFFLALQLNAIINGGWKKLLLDNTALLIGLAATSLSLQLEWIPQSNLIASIPPLIALGIYACVYGRNSSRELHNQETKIKQFERQQIQLKLRNYRLSKYLSPTLLQAIQSGKDVKLETHRRKLTIFFSDIKGFSELAEEMEGEPLTNLLNNYLTEMSQIALKHGATIDKFIGDAVMVFFGDPTSKGEKEDCLAAVSMAIAMKKHMKELQQRWANQGIRKPLEIRMGINTGYCAVGNFGTEDRLDYTLLGTEVNLASRLESAAQPGEILISHSTYSLIKDIVLCQDRGEIQVKGFQHPVKAYAAIDLRKNLGGSHRYFEHITDGFSFYMDTDRIRNYDQDKILQSLLEAAEHLQRRKRP
ncbi:MAG: adenylate/guanylate cyclase domain-containing protein [Gammaproteobacteria bacterium]|nr:MAG: adenylate/guanylate cyclase domain-containing protein [Gammaproteobacteria bacterium]